MELAKTVEFKNVAYRELCHELREVVQIRRECESREKELKAQIIDMSGGERMEYGVRISLRERQGGYDMQQIFNDLKITKDQGEKYRKAPTTYIDVRTY